MEPVVSRIDAFVERVLGAEAFPDSDALFFSRCFFGFLASADGTGFEADLMVRH
jgi:hypothetical protein